MNDNSSGRRQVDNTQEMKRVLRLLARAERLLQSGATMDEALERLQVERKEFETYFDEYALPPNAGQSLSASSASRAVFPIFQENSDGELEHVGSGVLLEIGHDLFALSAAHVLDYANSGALFMPAAGQLEAMHGAISHGLMPESGNRKEDRVDMAYFHLAPEWRNNLHPDIVPASVDDFLLTDTVATGNIHTFVGYPWRKTKHRGNVFSSDQTTYTGHLVPPDVYERLGYSRVTHILIRLRRKKTDSTRYGPKSPAPHPQGISGGAVLAWPSTFRERVFSPTLKIAAIAHSYHECDHCMAATRVISYMMAIVQHNPHLAVHFHQTENMVDELRVFLDEMNASLGQPLVPSVVGIAWYTVDTYGRCLRIFHDASDLPETFAEWQPLAESTEASLASKGIKVIRVEIDPDTFPAWCLEQGFRKIDGNARMMFANAKAFKQLQHGG